MFAYVMNLDTNKERWEDIQKEFQGSSIKLKRFNAIKDKKGAYGLMKSFIALLKLARKNKLKNVLILEDDCRLTKGWETNWKKILKWLHKNPDKWDIYSGSGWNIQMPKIVGDIDNEIIFFDPLMSWASNWTYIPQRNYNTLIKHFDKVKEYIKIPIVEYLFVLDNITHMYYKTIVSYPFMAYQEDKYTSNISQGILTSKIYNKTFVKEENILKKVYSTFKKKNHHRTKTFKIKDFL